MQVESIQKALTRIEPNERRKDGIWLSTDRLTVWAMQDFRPGSCTPGLRHSRRNPPTCLARPATLHVHLTVIRIHCCLIGPYSSAFPDNAYFVLARMPCAATTLFKPTRLKPTTAMQAAVYSVWSMEEHERTVSFKRRAEIWFPRKRMPCGQVGIVSLSLHGGR